MYCEHCGSTTETNVLFCPNCGARGCKQKQVNTVTGEALSRLKISPETWHPFREVVLRVFSTTQGTAQTVLMYVQHLTRPQKILLASVIAVFFLTPISYLAFYDSKSSTGFQQIKGIDNSTKLDNNTKPIAPTGISFLDIYLNENPKIIERKLSSSEYCTGRIMTWEERGEELFGERKKTSDETLCSLLYNDITINVYADTVAKFTSDSSIKKFYLDIKVYMTHYALSSPFSDVRLYYTTDKKTALSMVVKIESNVDAFVEKITEKYGKPTREEGIAINPSKVWVLGDQEIHCGSHQIYYFNINPIKEIVDSAFKAKEKKEAEPTPTEKALSKF